MLNRASALALAFLIAVSGASLSASPVYAQSGKTKDWTLNLKSVDIQVFLEQVSAITGENFVVDPEVKGKVSVIATTPMNAQAVDELLLTVLRVNSLAAVPSGPVIRIVPAADVKVGGSGGTEENGQQRVTRVVPVHNANIDEAVRLLKPLVSQHGYLEGSEFSNALIISDYADNVNKIIKALHNLDAEDNANIEVIPLKEAWVDNIVPILESIAPMQLAGSGKGRNRLRVVADEPSNSIIVRGEAKDRAKIRKLIETFDKKTPNASNIQVIYLKYADAKEIAGILRGSISLDSKDDAQKGSSATSQTSGQSMMTTQASAPKNNQGGGQGDITNTSSFIQADTTLNALIVKAEPAVMNEIRSLVEQLDTRRPQVLIEAAIVEISADKTRQLGVQLAGGDAARSINTGATQFSEGGIALGDMLTQLGSTKSGATTSEGLAIALGKSARFNVLIQALAGTTGANLLSTPSLVTLDNAEAKIVVGQNVPFRTGSFSTPTQNSGTTSPFTTIERQDVGLTLKVVPHVHAGSMVSLDIEQEVSSIAPANSQNSGAADIITNKRTIDTKVTAQDSETIVLGGLMQDNTMESESKVPLLGDIPVLGALFRYTSREHSKSNLLVFLKPTVLDGSGKAAHITQERYGRIYDLQIGKKNILDEDSDAVPSHVPPVDGVFHPATKAQPGQASSAGTGDAPFAESSSQQPVMLPWLAKKQAAETVSAVPVVPVAVNAYASPVIRK